MKESFPCTYFALICYDDGKHGGYGGVQTLDSGKHALIFSVWVKYLFNTDKNLTSRTALIRKRRQLSHQRLTLAERGLDKSVLSSFLGTLVM